MKKAHILYQIALPPRNPLFSFSPKNLHDVIAQLQERPRPIDFAFISTIAQAIVQRS